MRGRAREGDSLPSPRTPSQPFKGLGVGVWGWG